MAPPYPLVMSALPPKSGHVQRKTSCPLSANSGHRDYSITSRPSSTGRMVRPSAFAVLRLMTSSNLADCLIGSLPGFCCFPKRRSQTGQLPVLSCH